MTDDSGLSTGATILIAIGLLVAFAYFIFPMITVNHSGMLGFGAGLFGGGNNSNLTNSVIHIEPRTFDVSAGEEIEVKYSVGKNRFPWSKDKDVYVRITDHHGDMKASFTYEKKKPGIYTFDFRGEDEKGRDLPAGTYFIQVKIEKYLSDLREGEITLRT